MRRNFRLFLVYQLMTGKLHFKDPTLPTSSPPPTSQCSRPDHPGTKGPQPR